MARDLPPPDWDNVKSSAGPWRRPPRWFFVWAGVSLLVGMAMWAGVGLFLWCLV